MISATTYKYITDRIDSAQSRGELMLSYLDSMTDDLEKSEILSDDIFRESLEDYISTTRTIISDKNVSYTDLLLNFVSALQNYINDNYDSVNDFIRDHSILVKPIFADISASVGFTIDSDLIENIS